MEDSAVTFAIARQRTTQRDALTRQLLVSEAAARRAGNGPTAVLPPEIPVPSRAEVLDDPAVTRVQASLVGLRAALDQPSAADLAVEAAEAARVEHERATRVKEAWAAAEEELAGYARAREEARQREMARADAARAAREAEIAARRAEEERLKEAARAAEEAVAAEREAAEKARRQAARKAAMERMMRAATVAKMFAGSREISRENPEEQRRARRVRRVKTKLAVVRATRLCALLLQALREAAATDAVCAPAEDVDVESHIEHLSYLLECQGPYDGLDEFLHAMRETSAAVLGAEHRLTKAIVCEEDQCQE